MPEVIQTTDTLTRNDVAYKLQHCMIVRINLKVNYLIPILHETLQQTATTDNHAPLD